MIIDYSMLLPPDWRRVETGFTPWWCLGQVAALKGDLKLLLFLVDAWDDRFYWLVALSRLTGGVAVPASADELEALRLQLQQPSGWDTDTGASPGLQAIAALAVFPAVHFAPEEDHHG